MDPLTDAKVTSAVTEVWDATKEYFAEVTLTCTEESGGAVFDAAAVFFDRQKVGVPLAVRGGGGPQNVALLRVGDLEAVNLGLGRLSAKYSNQLFLLRGSTETQDRGDLLTYANIAQLPRADRLLIRPSLETGEPDFTISLTEASALQQVFSNCAAVFEHHDALAGEVQARAQVKQEQAELYAPRSAPKAEQTPPAPPRREDFQRRALEAEAACLSEHEVSQDPSDNAVRAMCADLRNAWRADYVNAASNYAAGVRARHYNEFGQHRWAAEGRAAAECFTRYEAARRAASASDAADAAAQAAADCYVAAGNPAPEPQKK